LINASAWFQESGSVTDSVAGQTIAENNTGIRASFRVSTTFSDSNPASVTVYVRCDSGNPEIESAVISGNNKLEFSVGEFQDGELDCLLSQEPIEGYEQIYFAFDDASGQSDSVPGGCRFTGFSTGDSGFCEIENDLLHSRIEVRRLWIDPGSDLGLTFYDEVRYSCENAAWGDADGSLWFSGKDDVQVFEFLPEWDVGTRCFFWWGVRDESIEFDGSECSNLHVRPGQGEACTIYVTRLYDDNSPQRWYGWVIMAVMVLVLGAVAAKQFNRAT
jgi:hypothetical protein